MMTLHRVAFATTLSTPFMNNNDPVRLVTLAPGHFHAALVQQEPLPGVDPHVHVYSPLDADLIAHLERISRFNTRADSPTRWTLDVHAGSDWFERFQTEKPGNVVIISGRNRPKIDLILAAVSAGYCVLADKPWIVEASDFSKLERVFAESTKQEVFARDIMTERWEGTSLLQRELMNDAEIFGDPVPGTPEEPALQIESLHYLCKKVAGVPLKRPVWWYDPGIAGEGVADVGTHLADLAMWMMFPDQAIDYRHDIAILEATRWPTHLDRTSFLESTGMADFPEELARLHDGKSLQYWGNGSVNYRLRDRFVRLTTRWDVRDTGTEGDTHLSIAHGSSSRVMVRHDSQFGPGPQVLVVPNRERDHAEVFKRIASVCSKDQGYTLVDLGSRIHIQLPISARTGHEAHFASVLGEFVDSFQDRSRVPRWECPNMLAKYFVTTEAVRIAKLQAP